MFGRARQRGCLTRQTTVTSPQLQHWALKGKAQALRWCQTKTELPKPGFWLQPLVSLSTQTVHPFKGKSTLLFLKAGTSEHMGIDAQKRWWSTPSRHA